MTAALLAALLAPPAAAGACCAGNTSVVPARLGECERFGLGLSGALSQSVGRWGAEGELAASSLHERAWTTELVAGYRWDRKAQLGVALPMTVQAKEVPGLSRWGMGPADARLSLLWDPLNELPRGVEGLRALPVPLFNVGLRLPTGVDWSESRGTLFEDVTGRPGAGLLLAAGLERTLDRLPWSLGLGGELSPTEGHLHGTLGLDGTLGYTLARSLSLAGRGSHLRTWADGGATARTSLGGALVYGTPLKGRSWLSVDADLPVPGLGRDNLRAVRAGVGMLLLR